jgi:hypothetical protein
MSPARMGAIGSETGAGRETGERRAADIGRRCIPGEGRRSGSVERLPGLARFGAIIGRGIVVGVGRHGHGGVDLGSGRPQIGEPDRSSVTTSPPTTSRRGNWEVMLRGLFTNRSVRNLLAPQTAPGATIHAGSGEQVPLWRAAERYAQANQSVVILAGERYGMGSSRDWAAKGVALLGTRAVLALGFERIRRSNLIGMGILTLRLPSKHAPARLSLKPGDTLAIAAEPEQISPRSRIPVRILRATGDSEAFGAAAGIETSLEVDILRAGGILPLILQRATSAHHRGR